MTDSRRIRSGIHLAIVCALGLALGACANNQKLNQDSARLNANGQGVPATPGTRRDFSQNVGDIVYFTTDSTDLTPEAQQTLTKQARWLGQYPQYTITIEGHADERGTREYNIALGDRRAQSVRRVLLFQGASTDQVDTVSYGEEQPAVSGHNEEAWARNRRVELIYTVN